MEPGTLQEFTDRVTKILIASGKTLPPKGSVLNNMAIIQEFYKQNHDTVLKIIEEMLTKDPSCSCPALLQKLDEMVNHHFGLDRDISMSDTIYDE